MNMTEQIFRVVIPEEETQEKMAKLKRLLKTFPGYVLVELIMTDESWVCGTICRCYCFVGSAGAGSKPKSIVTRRSSLHLKTNGS